MDKVINKYNSNIEGNYILVKDVQYVYHILWAILKVNKVVSEGEEYPYYEFDNSTVYELSEPCYEDNSLNSLKATALKYLNKCDSDEALKKILSKCDDIGPRYHLCVTPNPKIESKFYIFNSHIVNIISEEEYSNIRNEFVEINDKKVNKITRKYF